ncbi:TPA: hypothetical protein ACYSBI_001851 [Morganella morganii]
MKSSSAMCKREGQKNRKLSDLIDTLLYAHNIHLRDWEKRSKAVDLVRYLRNSVVHCNGLVNDGIYKEDCIKFWGEDLFKCSPHYPTLTFTQSLNLLREFKSIADEYSEVVFKLLQRTIC